MIRRGISRSIPSSVSRGPRVARAADRTFATQSPRSTQQVPRHAGFSPSRLARPKLLVSGSHVSAPAALGCCVASSSRHYSLWGFGWNRKKSEDASDTAAGQTGAGAPEKLQQPFSENADAVTDGSVVAPETSVPEPPPPGAGDSDMQTILDTALSGREIMDMSSHQYGYLEALGLDLGGFWPGSVGGHLLELVHVQTGLGWCGTIVATAVLTRLALLFVQIRVTQFGDRMALMTRDPRHAQLQEQVRAATLSGDRQRLQQVRAASKILRDDAGVSYRTMLLHIPNAFISFGLFSILRKMAAIPVPGFEDGGFLWFTSLSDADPFFILPIASSFMMISNVLLSRRYMPVNSPKLSTRGLCVFGVLMASVTSFLSAAVNLLGVATAAYMLASTLVLRVPAVRRWLGLKMKPAVSSSGGQGQSIAGRPKFLEYQPPRSVAGTSSTSTPTPTPTPMTRDMLAESLQGQEKQDPAEVSPWSMRSRLSRMVDETRSGLSKQMGDLGSKFSGSEAERAEKKRVELLRKLEEMRLLQDREQFEKKYRKKQ